MVQGFGFRVSGFGRRVESLGSDVVVEREAALAVAGGKARSPRCDHLRRSFLSNGGGWGGLVGGEVGGGGAVVVLGVGGGMGVTGTTHTEWLLMCRLYLTHHKE